MADERSEGDKRVMLMGRGSESAALAVQSSPPVCSYCDLSHLSSNYDLTMIIIGAN